MVTAEIMSTAVHTAHVQESVRDVISRLAECDVRHLPILEGNSLVGMISDRDLREFTSLSLLATDNPAEREQALSAPISSIMSSDLMTVSAETELSELIDLMVEYKIGAVPVVEAGQARLVGIVSYIDILKATLALL